MIGERAKHAVEVYEGGPAVGASSSVCSRPLDGPFFAVPQPSPGRPLIAARSILSLTPAGPFSSSILDAREGHHRGMKPALRWGGGVPGTEVDQFLVR